MLAEMTNINKVQQLFELKAAPTCFGLIAPVAVLQSKALVIVFALLSIFLSIGIYRKKQKLDLPTALALRHSPYRRSL